MKLLRPFLVSVLVAVVTPAFAADAPVTAESTATAAPAGDAKELVDAIEAKYKTVQTIEANFVQTKKDAFGEIVQKGDVVLKRPTKMRWRFTTGEETEFISNGSNFWIYNKASNEVIHIKDTSAANNTAESFLTSLDRLDEKFTVKALPGKALQLVPVDEGMYKTIKLVVNDDLSLKQVTFVDMYDNITDIQFNDVKLNGDVAEDLFNFKAPEGASVIDN